MPLVMRRVQAAMAGSMSFPLQVVQSAEDCWLGAEGPAAGGGCGDCGAAHGDGAADSASGDCSMMTDGTGLRLAEMLSARCVAVDLAAGSRRPSSCWREGEASCMPSCRAIE